MWGQQISQEEPQEKEVWERAGIAVFPHKETAFPTGLRLLSFIFEGCFLMIKKLVIMGWVQTSQVKVTSKCST